MNYNPYDLLTVKIGDETVHARVLQLDSDIVDSRNSKNAEGLYAVPSLAITVCPKCGSPIEFIPELTQPPFETVEVTCLVCEEKNVVVRQKSFIDPIAAGRLAITDFHIPETVVTHVPAPENAGFKLEKFERNVQVTHEIEENFDTNTSPLASAELEATKSDQKPKKPAKPKKKKEETETDTNENNIG